MTKQEHAANLVSDLIDKIALKKGITSDEVLEHMSVVFKDAFEGLTPSPIVFFQNDAPETFEAVKANPSLPQLAQAHFNSRVAQKSLSTAKVIEEWGDEDGFTAQNIILFFHYVADMQNEG